MKYEVRFSKESSFSKILDEAKKENKLVFLDLGAEWCIPCRQMKQDVYTDKQVGKILNASYISYLIDAEKNEGPDLKLIYSVYLYPTLLFIDSKGRIIERNDGSMSQSSLIKLAKKVAEYPR